MDLQEPVGASRSIEIGRRALAEKKIPDLGFHFLAVERLLACEQLGCHRQRTASEGGVLFRQTIFRAGPYQFQKCRWRYRGVGHERSSKANPRYSEPYAPFIRRR